MLFIHPALLSLLPPPLTSRDVSGATWGAPPPQGIPALHPLQAPLRPPHLFWGQAGISRAALSRAPGAGQPGPLSTAGAARADDAILGSPNMAAVRALRGPEALAGPGGIHGVFASRSGLLRPLRALPACSPRDVSSPGFTRFRRAITQRAASRGPPERRSLSGCARCEGAAGATAPAAPQQWAEVPEPAGELRWVLGVCHTPAVP